ncbi:SCPDL [Hepatospora eriocheir]|uniref:SCPDL n=1 Tax=Hepatospora eriocheir TaxID=1081669 RepID=A0A1X0QI87_9MICR|nr:SCPDL [Hepatospora eriocheir]
MKEYDLIIYGASSFTAKHLIKQLENDKEHKIAVSSRNVKGIKTTFDKISCTVDKIKEITSKTKILINLAGPYTHTGEEIINACIETNTHYIDITGEVHFLKDIYEKYKDVNNIVIVQSCGFLSFTSDFFSSYFFKNFNCKIILSKSSSKINKGTWLSLIESLKHYNEHKKNKNNSNNLSKKPEFYIFSEYLKKYLVRSMGPDNYILKRSFNYFNNYSCVMYNTVDNFFILLITSLVFFILFLLSKYSATRELLRKHYRIFSCNLVKDYKIDQFDETERFEMIFLDNKRIMKVNGPEGAYLSTSIYLKILFNFLLESNIKGLYTPSVLLKDNKEEVVNQLLENDFIITIQDYEK